MMLAAWSSPSNSINTAARWVLVMASISARNLGVQLARSKGFLSSAMLLSCSLLFRSRLNHVFQHARHPGGVVGDDHADQGHFVVVGVGGVEHIG